MPASPGKTAPAEDRQELLLRAVRRRYGSSARLENIVVPSLGGSNYTIIFDVVENAARRRLVSRQESYAAPSSPFVPPSVQFRVMRTAFEHQVPVPEPVFEYDDMDAMGAGFVTAFIDGETMPNRILKSPEFTGARSSLLAQFAETLALLHSINPEEVSFLETIRDSVDVLIAQTERLDAYAEPHPAIELGLRWLQRNRPANSDRRLLHGDFRVGNMMVGPGGLKAVLDWECCHIGNPAEDLGWLSMRSWRFGQNDLPVAGIGMREELLARYAAAGGRKIEVEEIRYWEIFGLARWAIINLMQAHGHVFGGRRSVVFAACGRNVSLFEYDLLMSLAGRYD